MRKILMMSAMSLGLTACASMDKGGEMTMSEMCEVRAFAVFFETGSAKMGVDTKATLDAVSKAYDDCDLYRIEVVGYADSVGTSGSNLDLSSDCARKVLAEPDNRGVMASGPGSDFDVQSAVNWLFVWHQV